MKHLIVFEVLDFPIALRADVYLTFAISYADLLLVQCRLFRSCSVPRIGVAVGL